MFLAKFYSFGNVFQYFCDEINVFVDDLCVFGDVRDLAFCDSCYTWHRKMPNHERHQNHTDVCQQNCSKNHSFSRYGLACCWPECNRHPGNHRHGELGMDTARRLDAPPIYARADMSPCGCPDGRTSLFMRVWPRVARATDPPTPYAHTDAIQKSFFDYFRRERIGRNSVKDCCSPDLLARNRHDELRSSR